MKEGKEEGTFERGIKEENKETMMEEWKEGRDQGYDDEMKGGRKDGRNETGLGEPALAIAKTLARHVQPGVQ